MAFNIMIEVFCTKTEKVVQLYCFTHLGFHTIYQHKTEFKMCRTDRTRSLALVLIFEEKQRSILKP